jgi:hypothetical protein
MAKVKLNVLHLDDAALARVIDALDYRYREMDFPPKEFDVNQVLISDIKGQTEKKALVEVTPAQLTVDQMNEQLQEKGHKNLYIVEQSRFGAKRRLELRDMNDDAPEASFHLGTTVEAMLDMRIILNNRYQEGVKTGRREMAGSLRDLIGAAADPQSDLME